MFKARFGLEPYRQKDLAGADFKNDLAECRPVEKTAESDNWAAANMQSILSKRGDYYGDWMKQEEAKRPRMLAEDGR